MSLKYSSRHSRATSQVVCGLLVFLSACGPSPASSPTPGVAPQEHTYTPVAPTRLPPPVLAASLTPPPAPIQTATSAPVSVEVCSPLKDISISELSQIVSNPYQQPRPGLDDGHHGVDLGFYRFGDRVGMRGLPILSVLPGRVAGVILDRKPYGYAIIIETPLEQLPAAWQDALAGLETAPTVAPAPALYCPTSAAPTVWAHGRTSLYLLYAHMNTLPLKQTGDSVNCGEAVGEVGTSGASVNEHLHLEMRLGPSETVFTSMAHYSNDATPEDMQAYCNWRVSGTFQMTDPLELLLLPQLP